MFPDSSILPQLRTNSSLQEVRKQEPQTESSKQTFSPSSERGKQHEKELDTRFRDELQKSEKQIQQERERKALRTSELNGTPENASKDDPRNTDASFSEKWDDQRQNPQNPLVSTLDHAFNQTKPGPSAAHHDIGLVDQNLEFENSEASSTAEDGEMIKPRFSETIETIGQTANADPQSDETESAPSVATDEVIELLAPQIADDSAGAEADIASTGDSAAMTESGFEPNSPVTSTTLQTVPQDQPVSQLEIDSLTGISAESSVEPDMSNSGFQSDLSDSSQSPLMTNGDGLSIGTTGQSSTDSNNPVEFSTSITTEIGRAVSQRVSEVIIQEVNLANHQESKQLTLHLHPAELGRLTLQVGWESDSIIAKIVASERATSELLNGDKQWLIDALQASGVELDSFDISHENTRSEQDVPDPDRTAPSMAGSSSNSTKSLPALNHANEVEGLMVNLIA